MPATLVTARPPNQLQVVGISWPEVTEGADLTDLLTRSWTLADGDVVLLTSKVVSKAEGRRWPGDRLSAVEAETVRVVARRGETSIAETRHGFVMAAAGVDTSNSADGSVLMLPSDPDASARALRERLLAKTGCNVAVVVTDTMGRAWRNGQTDCAVGCAGIDALVDMAGWSDAHGAPLRVTAPAVADELAGMGDLVKGKAAGRPLAVVGGLGNLVLPPGEHGLGARALVRSPAEDLFGLGSREAAVGVARHDPAAGVHLPAFDPAETNPFAGLLPAAAGPPVPGLRLSVLRGTDAVPAWVVHLAARADPPSAALLAAGRILERSETLALAHRLRPDDKGSPPVDIAGWRTLSWVRWVVA